MWCLLIVRVPDPALALVFASAAMFCHALWANITLPAEKFPTHVVGTISGFGGCIGGAVGGQEVARELVALVPPGVGLVGTLIARHDRLGLVEIAGAAQPLRTLQAEGRFVEACGSDAAQHGGRVGGARGHRQARIGHGLIVGRQLGQQLACDLRTTFAQDAVEAGDLVGPGQEIAVAV